VVIFVFGHHYYKILVPCNSTVKCKEAETPDLHVPKFISYPLMTYENKYGRPILATIRYTMVWALTQSLLSSLSCTSDNNSVWRHISDCYI